jgi:hypothetical protein
MNQKSGELGPGGNLDTYKKDLVAVRDSCTQGQQLLAS